MATGVETTDSAYAGQAAYTRGFLGVYDVVAYRIYGPLVWRCRKSRLLELYNANVSSRHLDIGVATGCMLDECRFPVAQPEITLMDLNQRALETAAGRLRRYAPRVHRANALDPGGWPGDSYDSVAMANLLHCLPGDMRDKVVALEHAGTALTPGGVLFGSTILGQGVVHTRLSRGALKAGNRRGLFSNLNDSLVDLEAGLARVFDSHEVQVEGAIALFTARTPV